ncbi:uncharacterized protein LOC111388864 [Olea europaea var. sylvestris]|uniref:uncharacterized protein LOC111388864 n=1 Tax=Olea europaea var. sylvestris TaxID=158386 RepID=UPI000C1D0284|nr:uncharacterized protein LOC111388864 [Olea europaea var. sylvestris]
MLENHSAQENYFPPGKINVQSHFAERIQLIAWLCILRCAEKLLYKKRKEKEQLKQKEKDNDQRKRDRSESGDDTDNEYDRKKERRKGKKASTSLSDHKIDDDENFDEYLEGMFP